jgi:hypothetical protein
MTKTEMQAEALANARAGQSVMNYAAIFEGFMAKGIAEPDIKPRENIVGPNGDLCPRCGQATQIREHRHIGPRELRGPFYYSKWFYCINKSCQTNVIVPERFRVYPAQPLTRPGKTDKRDRLFFAEDEALPYAETV